MAFPIEHNIEQLQEREISGVRIDAAVDCWYTSKGKSIPHLVKIKNDDGEIIEINSIKILKKEQKFYAGIRSRKFWCRSVDNGVTKDFYLLHFPDEGDGTWKLIM